jgi:hypothetical protein
MLAAAARAYCAWGTGGGAGLFGKRAHAIFHSRKPCKTRLGPLFLSLKKINIRGFLQAAIAQLVARRSHNPKVVSSILTGRIPCPLHLVWQSNMAGSVRGWP